MLQCYAQMHSTHDLREIQQVGFFPCVTDQAAACGSYARHNKLFNLLLACSCGCQKHVLAQLIIMVNEGVSQLRSVAVSFLWCGLC